MCFLGGFEDKKQERKKSIRVSKYSGKGEKNKVMDIKKLSDVTLTFYYALLTYTLNEIADFGSRSIF